VYNVSMPLLPGSSPSVRRPLVEIEPGGVTAHA